MENLFDLVTETLSKPPQTSTEAFDECYKYINSLIRDIFPQQNIQLIPLYQNDLHFASQDYIGTVKPLQQNVTDAIFGVIVDPIQSNTILRGIWNSIRLRTEIPMSRYLLTTLQAASSAGKTVSRTIPNTNPLIPPPPTAPVSNKPNQATNAPQAIKSGKIDQGSNSVQTYPWKGAQIKKKKKSQES